MYMRTLQKTRGSQKRRRGNSPCDGRLHSLDDFAAHTFAERAATPAAARARRVETRWVHQSHRQEGWDDVGNVIAVLRKGGAWSSFGGCGPRSTWATTSRCLG